MDSHPIENLMTTAMSSLENMIDVNKIIGDIITMNDGGVIIPVSKLAFGYAAGGSEFTTSDLKNRAELDFPFGGGSGAGVSISPIGFLIIKDGVTKFISTENLGAVEKIVESLPDVIEKAEKVVNSKKKTGE